jgi:tRNA(fMet)-specific endonuclease VapC|tara:strand:+ start:822 stop:1229 length:408 start_codon:yes stop_codon:yes gene_type:complete
LNYFLDTNICIYFLKGEYDGIAKNLGLLNPANIKIASIVKAELLFGAEKSKRKKQNLDIINKFLNPYEVVSFDDKATEFYSKIRFSLSAKGKIIGPNDLIIASIVLANDGILVTKNVKEFQRIVNLKIEDWTITK